MTLALLHYFTILQYFYRTSHRERFNTVQFAKAFLGFTEYNYCLHGFLVLINTYSSLIIGFLILPYLLTDTTEYKKVKNEDESPKDKSKVARYDVARIVGYMILITVVLFLCSSIMSTVTKRELMFP